MDWLAWHDGYDTAPALMARLREVRVQIRRALDRCPPGPLRAISICAGRGLDLLGALPAHARAADVRARLVELDPRLVAQGRAGAEEAGLEDRLEFIEADATRPESYGAMAPAHLVLACGVLGHVAAHDAPRMVKSLAWLCQREGFVIWTLGLARGGARQARHFQALFREHAFEEIETVTTRDGAFLVGTCRHLADGPAPAEDGDRLFTFVNRLDQPRGNLPDPRVRVRR